MIESRLEKSIAQLDRMHEFERTPSASEVFDASFLPPLGQRLVPSGEEAPIVEEPARSRANPYRASRCPLASERGTALDRQQSGRRASAGATFG